jgi:GntR family transcriptional regulator / MocR family aminotransferase
MLTAIDRNSEVPLGRQIYELWRLGILEGRFSRGERVPSTREMAQALGLSRGTVTQAYEQLVSEGYLEAAHGAGTFVCRRLPEDLLNAVPAARDPVEATSGVRLSRFGQRLTTDFAYPGRKAGHISLAHWGPDLRLFPAKLWHRCYARSLRVSGPDSLDYAENVAGHEALREEIARYVSRSRAVRASAEEVVVVSGSQQGLDLCARLLLEPGDEAVVENPGYLGASRAFQSAGARLRPVAVDGEGIVTSDLAGGAKLAYVTPAHQFPTGAALSLRRRLELLAWARRHRAAIIEDDYDSEYRYVGAPMPSLQGLASGVPVIYCGTFSKVMFPGLRVGYLVVPRELTAVFARAKWLADRHTPLHQQAALAAFMREGHLERHIRRMRRAYGLRREALVESLERHFGARAVVLGEPAGMHAHVRFDDPGLAARAAQNKVQLRDVAVYYLGSAPEDEYLLGFSMLSERSIGEAIRRLSEAPGVSP